MEEIELAEEQGHTIGYYDRSKNVTLIRTGLVERISPIRGVKSATSLVIRTDRTATYHIYANGHTVQEFGG